MTAKSPPAASSARLKKMAEKLERCFEYGSAAIRNTDGSIARQADHVPVRIKGASEAMRLKEIISELKALEEEAEAAPTTMSQLRSMIDARLSDPSIEAVKNDSAENTLRPRTYSTYLTLKWVRTQMDEISKNAEGGKRE